jgi:deoxyadenosine/deoxycytidine kinase
MAKLVFVEGNVGAGKSTVLGELQDRGFAVFGEPIEVWTEHLARVYHDDAWGLPMHYLALTTHVETILQAARLAKTLETTVVVERSFQSVDVFARNDPNLARDDAYWGVHAMYRRLLADELVGVQQHHVYLRASPKVCAERVRARGRPGEDGIDLAYLTTLHRFHDETFATGCTVDADRALSDVVDAIKTSVGA